MIKSLSDDQTAEIVEAFSGTGIQPRKSMAKAVAEVAVDAVI